MKFADVVIKNGAVFTGLGEGAENLAIAIAGDKILQVASDADIAKVIHDDTVIIDAKGNTVMAGFHDAHMHLIHGVLFDEYAVPLGDIKSLEAVQKVLAENKALYLTGDWLIGMGWDHLGWGHTEYPTAADIDKVISDRPVVLIHAEGHYVWVNSLALKMAGIDASTPAPDYGVIIKDDAGNPTGILIESAISLVGRYAYQFSEETKTEMVLKFQKHALSLGVTAVNEFFMSRAHEDLYAYETYKALDEADQLAMRIHVWPPMNGDLTQAKDLRARFQSPHLKVGGVKQFIDGVVTGHTALMVDEYKDAPGNFGETGYSYEQLEKWVIEADAEKFQIRFHSIGDGAVRMGLDLFEAAQKHNGVRDSRHSLEHLEVVDPLDLPRLKALGVQASIQPAHIALMPKESHIDRVIDSKHDFIYNSKTFIDQDILVPYASDYPITELNPFLGVYHAVTRHDYLGDVWNEKERVSLATALKAYTIEAAKSTFREAELGTLEAGKFADIVILDKDLFTSSDAELKTAKTWMTLTSGKVRFNAMD